MSLAALPAAPLDLAVTTEDQTIDQNLLTFIYHIAYWISFGPHGPRAQPAKGEGMRIALKTGQLILASIALFYAIHLFAKPAPRTMSKEWQEASNEYAHVCAFPTLNSRVSGVPACLN